MPNKKKILIFTDWFIPGYKAGGPIQSIANLINHLGDEFEFDVVTSNKDLGEGAAYSGIPYNQWLHRKNYQVIYLDEANQNLKQYREILNGKVYDCFYINSLFSVNFTLKPLWLLKNSTAKIILAPRGMLGKGALNIKPVKKKIFLNLFRYSGFANKICWHATADSEAAEIKHNFGEGPKVQIATNLSAVMTPVISNKVKKAGSLNLFFLSRISKKKNLRGALQYLFEIDKKYKVSLKIIGPVEDEDYWQSCLEVIESLPKNIKVNYLGAVLNRQLNEILIDRHFMLLPTYHENFGHVIIESWQNSCPVIISQNTPWQNLIDGQIGFDLALEQPQDFIDAIERAAAMNQEEFNSWSRTSYFFAKERTEDPRILENYRNLFK